jgi:hypothetical protein
MQLQGSWRGARPAAITNAGQHSPHCPISEPNSPSNSCRGAALLRCPRSRCGKDANVSLNRDIAGFFGFPTVLTFAPKSPDESDLSGFLPGAVRQHRTSSSPRQGSALPSNYERG